MLHDFHHYAAFVYGLRDQFPQIVRVRLSLYRRDAGRAALRGTIEFRSNIYLDVNEEIDLRAGRLLFYGYRVRHDQETLYWYDPQPHPEQASLHESFPHHRHEQPDVKHHRCPAPNLTFDSPNLAFVIREIVETVVRS